MSSRLLKREKDLCRCCHSEGACESLYAPYFWLDTEEVVYSKMLRECFDIQLATVRELSNGLCGICIACIQRLQDAVLFKRQIQKCERQFRDTYMLQMDYVFRGEVKEELPDPEDNDFAFANMTAGCLNGALKNDLESRTSDDGRTADDDGATADRQQKKDFKLEIEVFPLQTVRKAKRVRSKTPAIKIKKKKKGNHQKKSSVLPVNEEITNVQGTIQVVRSPRLRLLEGKDYTRVGDVFTCSRCEKTFKALDHLRIHFRRMHENIPRFTCPVCFEKFRIISVFTNHKLDKHNIDDRFKCNACDKHFNLRRSFELHMNGYHKLGVKKKCDKCDFETYGKLERHMHVHKTVKDYHCSYCTKSFKRSGTLLFHERIHTGDKRKACKECGQAFVQKASLNYHMSKYHPGVKF